jgi:hypothetical protein
VEEIKLYFFAEDLNNNDQVVKQLLAEIFINKSSPMETLMSNEQYNRDKENNIILKLKTMFNSIFSNNMGI